jgi:hypothetical protein
MERSESRQGALAGWMKLLLGSIVILLVAFVLIPLAQRIGPVRDVRAAIDRAGIDASALFYTEIETSFEAESSIRDALRYPSARHCAALPGDSEANSAAKP